MIKFEYDKKCPFSSNRKDETSCNHRRNHIKAPCFSRIRPAEFLITCKALFYEHHLSKKIVNTLLVGSLITLKLMGICLSSILH